jgi:hypothetical protein
METIQQRGNVKHHEAGAPDCSRTGNKHKNIDKGGSSTPTEPAALQNRYPDFDPHGKLKGIHIPFAVDTDGRLSDGAKRTYGYLQYHWGTNRNGRQQVCNPGTRVLAAEMNASVPSVERWLGELRKHEYIRTEHRGPSKPAEHYFVLNPRLEI